MYRKLKIFLISLLLLSLTSACNSSESSNIEKYSELVLNQDSRNNYNDLYDRISIEGGSVEHINNEYYAHIIVTLPDLHRFVNCDFKSYSSLLDFFAGNEYSEIIENTSIQKNVDVKVIKEKTTWTYDSVDLHNKINDIIASEINGFVTDYAQTLETITIALPEE